MLAVRLSTPTNPNISVSLIKVFWHCPEIMLSGNILLKSYIHNKLLGYCIIWIISTVFAFVRDSNKSRRLNYNPKRIDQLFDFLKYLPNCLLFAGIECVRLDEDENECHSSSACNSDTKYFFAVIISHNHFVRIKFVSYDNF